jgi:hypothetical protein
MEIENKNTYRFKCEIVEVINEGKDPVIKMICYPGSLIVEMPKKKHYKLGDHLILTGELHVTSTERDCDEKSEYEFSN